MVRVVALTGRVFLVPTAGVVLVVIVVVLLRCGGRLLEWLAAVTAVVLVVAVMVVMLLLRLLLLLLITALTVMVLVVAVVVFVPRAVVLVVAGKLRITSLEVCAVPLGGVMALLFLLSLTGAVLVLCSGRGIGSGVTGAVGSLILCTVGVVLVVILVVLL